MSVELHADSEVDERERPNVSGDLSTVFESAPMFRRAPLGYDRFQVDTYVRWAEDELSTADRERRHLESRHLATSAALDEARELLAHSSSGGEFLQLSRRLGTMLATAADEAESIHAAAEADRAAAAEEARQRVAEAEQVLAEARAEARRTTVEAGAAAEQVRAQAAHLVDEAERALEAAHATAGARIAAAAEAERHAAEAADLLRARVAAETDAARSAARDEIVRMLGTAREERRRADEAAAGTRERLDREAAARYVALVAEVEALQATRDLLRAEVDLLGAPAAGPRRERFDVPLRRALSRVHLRPRSVRAP